MKAYGISNKGSGKLHPANECSICSERKPPSKGRARNKSRKEMLKEIDGTT